ncbi:MAG: large-conductance mechanosensitive channel protein MscL [Ruminococcaceae bacterium]|nr:large-conductance mechanosensitive channel protein MscL [Oscillospiraceae bacterium]
MKKFFQEFRDFINKGNVVDMAVGVVIATAFGAITKSLVADIIMPLIGMVTGGGALTDMKKVLKEAVIGTGTPEAPEFAEVAIMYGNFIQTIIDFIIIALAVFVFVKVVEKAKNIRLKKEEEAAAEAPAPAPSNEEVLLTEIRDLLKENSNIKQ